MIPVGWNSHKKDINTQQNHGPVQDVLQEKEIIPGGFNSKRESSNNQHDLSAIEKKEMIPGGWSSQREANNTQHDPSPIQSHLEKKL